MSGNKKDLFPFCNNCPVGKKCCTGDEQQFWPYLLESDIERICRITGLTKNDFVGEEKHPSMGHTVFCLRREPNKTCLFFDCQKGECKIEPDKPIDCRLFLLDIRKKGREYHWIIYTLCQPNKEQIRRLIEYAQKELLPFLMPEIESYATFPERDVPPGFVYIQEILTK